MFLSKVTHLQAVPRQYLAGIGLVEAGQHSKQRGFSRTIETNDDHLRTSVDCQVDCRENFERTVALAQVFCH